MNSEEALKWAFESDWGTDWTKDCQAMAQLAEEVQRQRKLAATTAETLRGAWDEVERLTNQIAELKVAAGPFVRATRLQAILSLPDNKPVAEWLPNAWPTMRDAKRLVKAEESVQLGAEVLFCPVCYERLPKGYKVCCGVWHGLDPDRLIPPRLRGKKTV